MWSKREREREREVRTAEKEKEKPTFFFFHVAADAKDERQFFFFAAEIETRSLREPIAPLCPGIHHQNARLDRVCASGGLRSQCRGVWARGRGGVWSAAAASSSSSSRQLLLSLFLLFQLLFRRRRDPPGPELAVRGLLLLLGRRLAGGVGVLGHGKVVTKVRAFFSFSFLERRSAK